MPAKRAAGSSRSAKAGLVMPVARVGNMLRAGRYASRFGGGTAVFLAGALEYLVSEVVFLSGNIAKELRAKRITPRAVNLAVRSDVDLNAVLSDAVVAGGGVLPHLNKVSKKKKGRKGGKKGKKSAGKKKKGASGSPKKKSAGGKKKKSTKGKKRSSGKKKGSKKSKSKKSSGGKKSK